MTANTPPLTQPTSTPPESFLKAFWAPFLIAAIAAALAAAGNIVVTWKTGENAIELERQKDDLTRQAEVRKLDLEHKQKVVDAMVAYAQKARESLDLATDYLQELLEEGFNAQKHRSYEKAAKAIEQQMGAPYITLSVIGRNELAAFAPVTDEIAILRSHIGVASVWYRNDRRAAGKHYQTLYTRSFWSRSILSKRLANASEGKPANEGLSPADLAKVDYGELSKALTLTAPGQQEKETVPDALPWAPGTAPALSASAAAAGKRQKP
jgi:hypothetical protein